MSTRGRPGRVSEGVCFLTMQEKDTEHAFLLKFSLPTTYHSSLFIAICSSLLHPVAPTFSLPLPSVPLLLLPDYFGSDTQNVGGELGAGRQRVEAIFQQIQDQAHRERETEKERERKNEGERKRYREKREELRSDWKCFCTANDVCFCFLMYAANEPPGPLGQMGYMHNIQSL